MAKLLNIDAETDANIIDNGVEPALKIDNSIGKALAVSGIEVNTPILAASATINGIDIRGASVASGAVMSITGDGAYSLATIKATTGGVAGTYGVRVVLPDGTFGWLAIYPDGAVTADAL